MYSLHLAEGRGIVLKINSSQSQFYQKKNLNNNRENANVSFGSVGMGRLTATGNIMQNIENQGYLASFLIQDGLGMTAPRVWTGFNRDKEITGKYNTQEGFEVLGREGMTGPFIIAVAPAVVWLTGKFCKSTNTNTRLIKRYGDNLIEIVKKSGLDASTKNDAQKFKREFYKYNIKSFYNNTVPNDKSSTETIKYLLEEMEKFDSKDKNVSKKALSNITAKLNEKITETSSNLYNLNKIYVGNEKTKLGFDATEAIIALKDFGNDAITNNKDFAKIDEIAAENIKNNFATKRLLTNIANVVLTLGGLAVLPKIYARSDVSPGAQALEIAKQKNSVENNNSSKDVNFKGKGINGDGIFAKIGKFITKNVPEKAQELLEYTGYNFTKTTFACLSTFGLLLPRGKRAWDRAQIDENGKRDMTEINEILLRDTVSSLSVVFAVPLLTKALVRMYEDKVGFILTNKASEGKNMFKKFLDIINPYSDLQVLSVAELESIYGNIDSKSKLMNFAKFVDNKGGDLEKILSKSDNVKEMFNEKSFTLDSIKNLTREEKNKKIIKFFEDIKVKDNKAKHDSIAKLMKGSGDIKHNKIAKVARGLNSLPGFISTFIISPILLGILIPMLTYHNTRKAHEKMLNKN